MVPVKKAKRCYEKKAGIYDQMMHIFRTAPTVKGILESIDLGMQENPKILDIGCGTGYVTEVMQCKYPDAQITALDLSDNMLKIYSDKFPNNQLVKGDFNDPESFITYLTGEEVILEDSSFDIIVSISAVSEYGDLGKVLPQIYRWLTPNGVFINIGIKKSLYNRVSALYWKFNPVDIQAFKLFCMQSGFMECNYVPIGNEFFPSNYLKFAVVANK